MDLQVQNVAIAVLKPRPNNPRTHSKKQLKQLADSIREFGFVNPVLIDAEGGIIAGHGRVEAAKLLGMTEAPAVRVDHLTEAQIRAYVIADNKLALNAGWDEGLLRLELKELSVNLGFDVTLTGFETAEIDNLIIGGEVDEDDQIEEPDHSKPAVSRMGDLWLIGQHRVLCADATKPESYARLLGDQRAQLVFTDPRRRRSERHRSRPDRGIAEGPWTSSARSTQSRGASRGRTGYFRPRCRTKGPAWDRSRIGPDSRRRGW